MNGGREFLQILSEPVRKQLEKTEISFAGLQEVRIRVGRPVLLRVWGKEYSLDCLAGQRDIQETLSYAGNYSLYAYEEEFRQGFLQSAEDIGSAFPVGRIWKMEGLPRSGRFPA